MSSSSSSTEPAVPQRGLLRTVGEWLRSLVGQRNGDASFRESVAELIDEAPPAAAARDEDERTMFRNLLSFGDLDVADVMVPRTDIVAVSADTALDQAIKVMHSAGHSRLPVYRDTLDDVLGLVHVRDMIGYWGRDEPFALEQLVRPLLFVPMSMPVRDLLLQMRATKVHMALVVDEHGGTDGLVTIEDLVEEIVGEIEDEHDRTVEPELIDLGDGRLEADARLPVAELERALDVDLLPDEREDDIDTLGGLVSDLAGRVPARGELLSHPSGVTFEIIDAEPRKIRKLLIHRPNPAQAESA